jgi:hypothetical protein
MTSTNNIIHLDAWMDFNDAAPQVGAVSAEPLSPDQKSIVDYMDLVFGYCEGWIPLRGFAERGQERGAKPPHTIWVEADEMDELASAKEKALTFGRWTAREGMAFYVIPGTVAEHGQAKATDIIQTQVILADLDCGDTEAKLNHLTTYMGEPTAIIESGGITPEGLAKLHVYWRLSEPAEGDDIALACRIRHQIAVKAGGDIHFQSAHQPIRVAGSVYHKHGLNRLVTFRSQNHMEYHLQDLAESVDDMPPMEGINTNTLDYNDATISKPTMGEVLTTPIREGDQDLFSRFTGASAAIGHYVRIAHSGQMTRDEAWEAIAQYNAAMLRPPWPQDRLAAESQRLWDKHCEKYGSANATNIANTNYTVTSFTARQSLETPSPIPQDIISPRVLTPGGMWIIAGPPKVGKSDLMLNLFAHAAAGIDFLGFQFHRPLRVFYVQSEVEKPYLDERLAMVLKSQKTRLDRGLDNLHMTDRFKFRFNENGVEAIVQEIKNGFPDPDYPVDIIAVDPFRNIYQSGLSDGGDINEDLLEFFTHRLEFILADTHPKAGMIVVHHTNKITGKALSEDPMNAISGGGAILSYPTALTVMGKAAVDTGHQAATLWFDIRNGPPIPSFTIIKHDGAWSSTDSTHTRLVGQRWGELNDREQHRKRRAILEFIFEESRFGRLYTSSSLAKVLAGQFGLGGESTIRRHISMFEIKGFIRFINGKALKIYNLTRPRSPNGYLCVEGMARDQFYNDETEEMVQAQEYLPTHYRDEHSEQIFDLKEEDIHRWHYKDLEDENEG